jgi:hypothetical protein
MCILRMIRSSEPTPWIWWISWSVRAKKLVRSGHEWRWKRYDSVTVRGNEWFRHSRKEGGHAIDFVQEFYDMSFPEAVQVASGRRERRGMEPDGQEALRHRKKEFALPDAESRHAAGVRLSHQAAFY